ncbi:hypothetical protein V6N13_067860 [Hibiscus sabdariffa]
MESSMCEREGAGIEGAELDSSISWNLRPVGGAGMAATRLQAWQGPWGRHGRVWSWQGVEGMLGRLEWTPKVGNPYM